MLRRNELLQNRLGTRETFNGVLGNLLTPVYFNGPHLVFNGKAFRLELDNQSTLNGKLFSFKLIVGLIMRCVDGLQLDV